MTRSNFGQCPMWILAGSLLVSATGCMRDRVAEAGSLIGDPAAGREAIRRRGCASCHQISAIRGAEGRVGPPLDGVARRVYLAGVLPNTPHNMAQWIQHPRKIDPRTAMPGMGIPEAEARDIVAYLYTLR